MAYGQIAIAEQTGIASASAHNFTPSDFTMANGNAVQSGDAVIIRSVLHGDDVTINRTVDPDADGTFEINEQITSRAGGGEFHSATHPVTQDAGIEVLNDGASAQDVVVIAEFAESVDVFVESVDALSDSSELTRTTASRGTDESILELVVGADADLDRRYDADDDGTFEIDQNVASYAGQNVVTGVWLSSVDTSGRTNAAFQNALVNTSGGAADYAIIGTITDA
jgi:methylmalonyl-CoA mutase cobalamin-binding subunit